MSFAWLDSVVIIFVAISILIGIFRGLIKEMLSLVSWGLAVFIAYQYGVMAAGYLTPYINEPTLALAIAYTVVFLLALIVFSIISYMINRLFSATGISVIDRLLGSVFGAVRAAAILGVLILGGHFLNLNQQSWWQEAQLLDYFQPVADWIEFYLPDTIADKIADKITLTSTPSAADAAVTGTGTISSDDVSAATTTQ